MVQLVMFKLSYYLEETIGFDIKALFASCPEMGLIRSQKEPGDVTKEFLIKGYSVPWDFS